ncbi:SLC45 family MFS transporter [Lactococcus lactis]|uniref:SLC45 family MFS transporter n=1 Tax=Lactococcus lactis TaxID=1358 RepID=UPI0022E120F1|nr:SLC45 family MFS transporter [Lactococcus lactis]
MLEVKTSKLPTLPLKTIWMLSFGYLGVQMAFSLQSSNMGRIFETLGADPTRLGFFFILPPLAGIFVQPIVGKFSDKTWAPRIGGRRLPYLLISSLVAMIVLALLPNSGSFGFSIPVALWFGATAILFMDLSSNIAMQPFKMIVGDMVNEKQKGYAYSIQSLFSNTGAVLASIFPFVLTAIGIHNTAPSGQIPKSVIVSFYAGAAILIICSLITVFKVKEYPPEEYAAYHTLTKEEQFEKISIFKLLARAPRIFWTITVVQFFCWMGFQYLWTYGTGAISQNIWGIVDPASAKYQAAGNWFGMMSAVQAVSAVIWSYVLAKIPDNRQKGAYALSLLLGGIGFISFFFIHIQIMLVFSFALIGISWAAMMSFPFIFLTNGIESAGEGAHMGTFLGLFNGSICFPQIVASIASFILFPLFGSSHILMILLSGFLLIIGASNVFLIKDI